MAIIGNESGENGVKKIVAAKAAMKSKIIINQ
jgi:hypothetical protein